MINTQMLEVTFGLRLYILSITLQSFMMISITVMIEDQIVLNSYQISPQKSQQQLLYPRSTITKIQMQNVRLCTDIRIVLEKVSRRLEKIESSCTMRKHTKTRKMPVAVLICCTNPVNFIISFCSVPFAIALPISLFGLIISSNDALFIFNEQQFFTQFTQLVM